jgi:hypothetical protein
LILLPWERCKALVKAIISANWTLVLGAGVLATNFEWT